MWLAAAQLKIFTDCHGMDISLMRIIRINLSTEFYNLFLPGFISGGVIRWYRLSRGNNMRAQALAVIVTNRLLNLIVLLSLGILAWLFEGNHAATKPVAGFVAVCLLALTAGFLAASKQWFAGTPRRRVLDTAAVRPIFREKLRKLINAANEYRRIPLSGRWQLGCCATGWHLVMLLSNHLFCMTLDISVSFSTLAWIWAIVTLAVMLPLSISGFGIRKRAGSIFLEFMAWRRPTPMYSPCSRF